MSRPARGPSKPGRTDGLPPTSESRPAVRPRANHAVPSLLLAAPHASRRWAWTIESRPAVRPRANHAGPSLLLAAPHASRRWAWTSESRPAVRPRANHASPSPLLAASHASRRRGDSAIPPNGVRYFAPLRPGGWSDSPHPLVRSGAIRPAPARLPNSGRPPAVSPKTLVSWGKSCFYGACHGSQKEVFGFGTAIADVFFRADD